MATFRRCWLVVHAMQKLPPFWYVFLRSITGEATQRNQQFSYCDTLQLAKRADLF